MKTRTQSIQVARILGLFITTACLALPAAVQAQTVIGNWQNNTGDGWIDWGNTLSITNAANVGKYAFVSGAVSGYAQSLQIAESGYQQNLAIKLENLPGGVAAFLTNHLLSFTFSVPSAASSGSTAGFSQLYELAINATGYGFVAQSFTNFTATGTTNNNLSGQPNFYFYNGAPAQSQTVTVDYSSALPSITATPANGYVELIFAFNNGGGAATNYFINNVVLSGGSTTTTSTPPSGNYTFTLLNGPTYASLNSSNGVFAWRPHVSQAGTTNLIKVKVTDNSNPSSSATNSFTVVVNPLIQPNIGSIQDSGGQLSLAVTGTQGPDYTVLASTNLTTWSPVLVTNSPTVPLTLGLPNSANPEEFYRLQVGP